MIDPKKLERSGRLPLRNKPARFAVGDPAGASSNSWRVWKQKQDLYIACRDNFRETKVSLHASGRWRMGFTSEAIADAPHLLGDNQNRAWEIWDRPDETLPSTVVAFHLIFATSELAVHPEQRATADWKDVIFVEAAPTGKVTVATLFITSATARLRHETEPSFVLGTWALADGRCAQLVFHGDPEGTLPELIASSVRSARGATLAKGVDIPEGAYGYFLGHRENGARFLFGAKVGQDIAGGSTAW
jgi:hypothetical protein